MLRRIWAITQKEFIQLWRFPLVLIGLTVGRSLGTDSICRCDQHQRAAYPDGGGRSKSERGQPILSDGLHQFRFLRYRRHGSRSGRHGERDQQRTSQYRHLLFL